MKFAMTFLFLAFLVTMAAPAFGHTIGISRGDYRVRGADVAADLVFARPEVAGSVPGLDTDHDGTVSEAEIVSGRQAIEDFFVQGLSVRSQSGECPGTLKQIFLTEEDGISISGLYHCAAKPETITLNVRFLSGLSHGHRHLAAHKVVYAGNTELQFANDGMGAQSWLANVVPMFRLGIQHILTGYDHLVFLLGLILVGGRVRSILVVITAFTIAHSITLGMAALQIWTPRAGFVEPAIALSIAYIGVENWFVKDASRRWMITFPFGLIHGFGFAGALRQISLPHAEVPVALLSFNAGVELGQLAVLALVLPAILWLRRRQWFLNHGIQTVSTGIAVAGICWFLSRIS